MKVEAEVLSFGDCVVNGSEVERHAENCFDSLRKNILALDLHTQDIEQSARVEALENIVHLLIFEMALSKAAPSNSHLSTAYTLLRQIMGCSPSSHEKQYSDERR